MPDIKNKLLQKQLDGTVVTVQDSLPFKVPYNLLEDSKTSDNPSTIPIEVLPSHGYDGIRKVIVPAIHDGNLRPENIIKGVTILGVEGNATKDNLQQNKTINPPLHTTTFDPNLGFRGMEHVTVNGVIDSEPALVSENIKKNVSIYGVVGVYDGGGSDLYDGDVTLTTNPQTFNPEGHDGFSSIKVSANISSQGTTSSPYTITVDNSFNKDYATIPKKSSQLGMSQAVVKLHSDIEQYIKKDTKILGVTGKYEGGTLGTKTVDPSSIQNVYKASDDELYGYSEFTVNAIQLDNPSDKIVPSIEDKIVTPASGKYMNSITVAGDSDLLSENIISGKSIFGVDGSYTVGARNYTGITSDTTGITIYPNNTNAMSSVYIKLDDSMAQYIKSGVYILGVEGTYTGGDTPTPTPTTYQVYDYGSWKNGYYYGFNVPSGVNETKSGSYFAFSTTAASSGTYYVYTTYKISVPSGYTKLSVYARFSSTSTQESCSFGFSSSSSVSSASYSSKFSNGSNSTRTVSVSGISSGYISFKISDRLHSSTSISVYSIYFEK